MTTVAINPRPRVTSERITRDCIGFAEDQCGTVSMRDLCAASGASERRVRRAFHECYGTSPMSYLRAAALGEVRRDLLTGPSARDAVTRAASDRGFHHLSRFAGQYHALFGEYPSVTLSRARLAESG
jgi:transcriptional regulator GlxA family with amidase domain